MIGRVRERLCCVLHARGSGGWPTSPKSPTPSSRAARRASSCSRSCTRSRAGWPQNLTREKQGQTLDVTALVHEAYLRLVGTQRQGWNGRHFFAAAAEAMRRILVESAHRKLRLERGVDDRRVEVSADDLPATATRVIAPRRGVVTSCPRAWRARTGSPCHPCPSI
jgi:hypothetical protein